MTAPKPQLDWVPPGKPDQGRGALISRIRRISKLESEAVAELEKALEALG